MDQEPVNKRRSFLKLRLNRISCALMILGIFLLIITGLRWVNEVKTDRAYARLSSQQEALSPEPIAESPAVPPRNTSQGAADEPAYPNRTNPNARWLAINPDYSGWIWISGTRINYPYVRGKDNEDYLRKDFYGKPARAGTVFLDYRNLGGAGEAHTLLYGHNMKNGTMFHDLVKYHDAEFLLENPLITLTDLYGRRNYRIFSVYEISAEEYTLPLNFKTKDDYRNFLKDLADLSMHEMENIPADAQLLSLITCSYGVDNGRTIIHALAENP